MAAKSPALGVMYRREQDPAGLIAAARRAEELGFDQFWIVEDCFYLGGISQAAIALTATTSIRIGIGINPGVAHNPAILAMEYATLERAFPGRLIGGIGHGVTEWMKQIGESVASPLTAMEEIATSVRRLLHGERITVTGRYVQLQDVVLDPPPASAPPVVLGVRGPKSVALAGRVADGVLLAENSAPEFVRQTREVLDAGRSDPAYLAVYVNTLVDDAQPGKALAQMRDVIAGWNGSGLTTETRSLPYASELARIVAAGGADLLRAEMPDAWVRDLGIVGSVEEGRQAIDRYAAASANAVIFVPAVGWNWSAWLEQTAALLG